LEKNLALFVRICLCHIQSMIGFVIGVKDVRLIRIVR